MAANEYYAGSRPEPPRYDELPPSHDLHPPAFSKPLPSAPYTEYTDHETSHSPSGNAYRESQTSLSFDNQQAAGTENHGADPYAENIPLRSSIPAQTPTWAQQNTAYGRDMPRTPDVESRTGRGRREGFFKKKIAWVTYLLTIVDIGVFIAELVKSGQLTGSPIETKPTFNPMIGPSPYIQIYMGARFVPCMKNVPGVQDNNKTISWNCPNSTSSSTTDPSNQCSLSELCGFSGVPNPHPNGSLTDRPEPNQWFRFIIPMFLHGGFVHITFNLLVQMTMGADMERMIGWWRFALVYLASGIFGFVLGGNYAAQGITSTGASGSLFGVLALFVLDLFYTWRERQSPWIELIILVIGVGISFFLGLLPGLDNFSHIGGFTMGLAIGLCILRSPNAIRERIGLARTPYVVMSGGIAAAPGEIENSKRKKFLSARPFGFFRGRKPLWWAWWLVRAGALVAVIVGFIILLADFYKYPKSNCSWCYRLSCLPINNWCSLGQLDLN